MRRAWGKTECKSAKERKLDGVWVLVSAEYRLGGWMLQWKLRLPISPAVCLGGSVSINLLSHQELLKSPRF